MKIFAVVFLLAGGCLPTRVYGDMTGSSGWRMVPNRCNNGLAHGWYGVDLWAHGDPTTVRLIHDEARGDTVRIFDRNGSVVSEFTPEDCQQQDDVRLTILSRRGWGSLTSGTAHLQCEKGGARFSAQVDFENCEELY